MYHRCIFCSADLGRNESIEEFPVGRALAFDAWKGRLWAICPRCRRWNLSPIEERWEAVERAEGQFRDARLRVAAENVGLAQLSDGTRLVRVGDALPGELAAWRYGRELRRRRWRYWLETGIGAAVSLASGLPAWPGYFLRREVIWRVPADASPNGRALRLRRLHLHRAEFHGGSPAETLHVRIRRKGGFGRRIPSVELQGRPARVLLERVLVGVNQRGASRSALEHALHALASARSSEDFVRRLGGGARGEHATPQVLRIRERWRSGHWRGEWLAAGPAARGGVDAPRILALEMALHEESERKALGGELAELEERWREAEEIAAIADSL